MKRNGGWNATTRSRHTDQEGSAKGTHPDEPLLLLSLAGQQPLVDGECISLAQVDEVVIGRGGPARAIVVANRRVSITVPDDDMSREHAVLRQAVGAWRLADGGSKHGTFVNGERVTRRALDDNDTIQIGSTIFVLRLSASKDAPDGLAHERSTGNGSTGNGSTGNGSIGNGSSGPPILHTQFAPLKRELQRLAHVAPSGITVLVRGESGTGKELVAKAVHRLSDRKGAFVPLNCGAIPESLVESELFGHVRGAFTGAHERLGAIRTANRGTLLLDEIGDLPLAAQAALLRVLQEREVVPLGTNQSFEVDIQVVGATHRELRGMVNRGEFRQDLYARLAGFELTIPPLRDRREDIGVLISALLREQGPKAAHVTVHPKAARALFSYHYPLNVRELENALGLALAQVHDGQIRLEHLPETSRGHWKDLAPEEDISPERLMSVLRETNGNMTRAASTLGEHRTQIARWCKKYSIDHASFRKPGRVRRIGSKGS